jgi:hypothetical protein
VLGSATFLFFELSEAGGKLLQTGVAEFGQFAGLAVSLIVMLMLTLTYEIN